MSLDVEEIFLSSNKGKVEQSRERSSGLPLHLGCSGYWKGSFRVALAYGRQLYLFYLIILHI